VTAVELVPDINRRAPANVEHSDRVVGRLHDPPEMEQRKHDPEETRFRCSIEEQQHASRLLFQNVYSCTTDGSTGYRAPVMACVASGRVGIAPT